MAFSFLALLKTLVCCGHRYERPSPATPVAELPRLRTEEWNTADIRLANHLARAHVPHGIVVRKRHGERPGVEALQSLPTVALDG